MPYLQRVFAAAAPKIPHYEKLIVNKCWCVHEKGGTFALHPHVTTLIT